MRAQFLLHMWKVQYLLHQKDFKQYNLFLKIQIFVQFERRNSQRWSVLTLHQNVR